MNILKILIILFSFSLIAENEITTVSESTNAYKTTARSIDLEVSYDIERVSMITPDQGDIKDMCLADVRMLQEFTKLYSVTSTISKEGEFCSEVIRKRKISCQGNESGGREGSRSGSRNGSRNGSREGEKGGKGRKGKENEGGGTSGSQDYCTELEATTKYCNGILTYITEDTTLTKSVTVNFEFWKQVAQGYLYTESEVEVNFETMIQTQKQNGAQVVQDNNTISVTETSATGETITSVYNKHTNLLMYTELKDANGEKLKTFAYEYTCSPQGKIVPKSIMTTTTSTSAVCKTPFTKNEWMTFANFQTITS